MTSLKTAAKETTRLHYTGRIRKQRFHFQNIQMFFHVHYAERVLKRNLSFVFLFEENSLLVTPSFSKSFFFTGKRENQKPAYLIPPVGGAFWKSQFS